MALVERYIPRSNARTGRPVTRGGCSTASSGSCTLGLQIGIANHLRPFVEASIGGEPHGWRWSWDNDPASALPRNRGLWLQGVRCGVACNPSSRVHYV